MATSCANIEYGALRHDILDFTGDKNSFTVTFQEDDGTPVDISADTFYLLVEKSKGVTAFQLELGDGIEVIGAGQIQISISSANSALLPPGTPCNYWVRWIRPGVDPETPVFGRLVFARNPSPTS